MDWFTVGADSSSRRVVAVSEERTSDGMETIYTVTAPGTLRLDPTEATPRTLNAIQSLFALLALWVGSRDATSSASDTALGLAVRGGQ